MIDYTFTLYTIEHFALILMRMVGMVAAAPFFSQKNTPVRVRVGLSAVTAILLMNVVDYSGIQYGTTLEYTLLVIKEVLVGLFMGFAANLSTFIVLFAGNMIDTHLGLAMATEYDPQHGAQTTLNATMYNYVITLLLIISDMHRYILRALADSYRVIPIGNAVFNWDEMLGTVMTFFVQMFIIAFRITLPVFSVIMILNCTLGIMAKVAPQMNMFAVGMQLKALIGFTVLLLTVMLLPRMAEIIFENIKIVLVSMIEGMMP